MFKYTRRTTDPLGLVLIVSTLATLICTAALFGEYRDGTVKKSLLCALCGLSLISFLSLLLLLRQTRIRTPSPLPNLPASIHHLLQSLEMQRSIMKRCFEHAPFGVLLVSTTHDILYINPAFTQMSGYPAGESDVPEVRLDSLFALLSDTDPNFPFSRLCASFDPTFCHLRQSHNEELPVLLSGFPLTDLDSSHAEGFILFVRDVSPSQQLLVLQQQFAFLLNSLAQGVVLTDRELNILYVNDAFCRLLGKPERELLRRPLRDVRTDEDKASFSQHIAELALATDEMQTAELALPLADSCRHYEVFATPVKDVSASSIGVLLLYQDRTAEKELHDAMRRHDQLETVSQMAASIAHEVRNPMTSVQGFLQLMSREIDPAHAHSMYLHVMEEDLKRINSIITEYLNFSKMGSDAVEDVRIGTLLHNTYTLLLSEANLKGIQIDLSLGGDPLLPANPNRLKQVLINLARNAMEAMEGGGILTLSLETTETEVCLRVADTGPGILPDDLSNIFSPFYTTKKTGTGLGLAISKKIIDEHGGTLAVQTEQGRGTIFSVCLPKSNT